MTQLVFVIVGELFFGGIGLRLLLQPEQFLVDFGRPATQKHVRAMRLIGIMFLLMVALSLTQWVRSHG
jgi:hypothetical protein